MIPRERRWILLAICAFLLMEEVSSQGEKSYDTNEWIPITPSSLQASGSEVVEQKTASDRVLSLDAPAQRFFPDEEYDYRNRRPNQVQPFQRESASKKGFEPPRPRKLKHPSEYKFETPPPPPSKNQPQINYYNGENILQPQHNQQNYYAPLQQLNNQRPVANKYVSIPSVNPQVPAPDAPNLYEQYQLPFNATFYQSLNPSSINNDFYQAITNGDNNNQQNSPVISNQQKFQPKPALAPKPSVEQESVQLVYVPVENLRPNQPLTQDSRLNYHQVDAPKQGKVSLSVNSPQVPLTFKPLDQSNQEKRIYNPPALPQNQEFVYQLDSPRQEKLVSLPEPVDTKQARLEYIQQDFVQQALQAHKLQEQLRDDINPVKQDIFSTTAKPKQKPHQPPLSVFLESQKKAEISDVLNILRGAKTISVQDNVAPDSPQIFIGPSNLDSPDGYTKFPLPYLNNINGNRIERKIDQLPFFVAPVSYKAPPGYSKISLPSPHVGSVVVSVPLTSTTPEPVLLNQNQVNPFTFSSPGYSPLSPSGPSRPQQNILDNYNILEPSRDYYQSTPTPQVTESPLIPPVRNIFENSFAPRQPDPYYSQQQNSNVYRPEIQEQQRYQTREETHKTPSSTAKPKQNSNEQSQLPDINPLELAINEFELHQINDELEEHNKVKHSTTRRPQTSYEDNQSVSNTRSPPSRGRHTYENEPTTEKTISRGRVRGRGRGTTTRTTTTTTADPTETDRYTVLEEFVAREPSRGPSTENYRVPLTEAETLPPRRTTTPFSGNPYLPEQSFERSKSQLDFGSQPQIFENSRGNIQYENQKTDRFEPPKRQPKPDKEAKEPQTIQQPNQFYSGNADIENIPANVYSLGQSQTYETSDFGRSRNPLTPTRLEYENTEQNNNVRTEIPFAETSKPEQPTPSHVHRFSPEVISYENREPNQRRPQERPNYQQYEVNINEEPDVKQAETYERPPAKIREHSVEEQKPKQQSADNPSDFLENLFQPNFDQTYISLQDQAVRSLLDPNLLVPSTKQDLRSTATVKEDTVSSTEPIVKILSNTEEEITTTTRATRVRGRGRARPATTESTVTSASRRPSSRRRPTSRTSTERISSSAEYTFREDNGGSGSNAKQRFRTRGRTNQNEITDRVSTTENDIRAFKEPISEGGFEALNSRDPPQSYMQFEHAIDEQQIITINPDINQDPEIKEYHQVYSLPQQNTNENQQIVLEYENTKLRPTPILDVQVAHEVPEENERRLEIPAKPTEEESYSRYNNANIKSGGVLRNNKPEATTSASTTQARGRTRGRSRFATTPSTSRSVTRISTRPTNAPSRTTTQKEENQSYGFTRQPSYTPSNLNIQSAKVTPSRSRNEEQSVQFLGEIRPKYTPRTTTAPSTDEIDIAETPRPKIRARTRAPARKTTNNGNRQLDNDVQSTRGSEQVTRRTGTTTKVRGRGSSHYRAPENVKRASDEKDVANQNYPVNFLQKLDSSSPKPTTAGFQITIDPLDVETDDQSPYSSFYRPKFVPKPSEWADPNKLPSVEKSELQKSDKTFESETTEVIQTSEEPHALAFIHTTEASQQMTNEFTESEVDKVMSDLEKIKTSPTEQSITTLDPTYQSAAKKKSRRRGVWKLVKHRPVDPLEVSESQNYQTVLNAFESIEKVDPYLKSAPIAEKSYGNKYLNNDLLNSNNFGQEIDTFNFSENINNKVQEDMDTEDIVTIATNTITVNTEPIAETNVITSTPSTIKTQENIFDTIYEMFGIFHKPGKHSNESSLNENLNSNVPTTVMNPTFPDEITEISATTTTGKVAYLHEINGDDKEKTTNNKLETTESILPATLVIKSSTKPYDVEPWEMRAVKTSTSTEISHETEICYKGRCVKSKEKKKYK